MATPRTGMNERRKRASAQKAAFSRPAISITNPELTVIVSPVTVWIQT